MAVTLKRKSIFFNQTKLQKVTYCRILTPSGRILDTQAVLSTTVLLSTSTFTNLLIKSVQDEHSVRQIMCSE